MLFIFASCTRMEYKIKITFCDGRPPVITTVGGFIRPTNADIINEDTGVPYYQDGIYKYMNVCNIENISESKITSNRSK